MMANLDEMRDWVTSNFPGRWENAQKTDWLTSSPFREDKHPSFSISVEKRCAYDRATGESWKLSELCKELRIAEPDFRKEENFHSRGDFQATAVINKNALIAGSRWKKAQPAPADFPYLLKKQVSSYGLKSDTDRELGQVLLIPAVNVNGEVEGIERIAEDGTKKHLGTKKGCYFLIGEPQEGKEILVAEGYATSASLFEITSKTVACAFSANNMIAVSEALKDKYSVKPVICPDSGEAGAKVAQEALRGGFKVITMPDGTPAGQDWNDIYCEQGKVKAVELFREQEQNCPAIKHLVIDEKERLLFEAIECPDPASARRPEKVWHFPRKHLNLLAADAGMGKSILITKVAADLSLGVPVLDGKCEPIRKTLYLNGEVGKDYFNWRFKASGWSFSEEYFKVVHQETLSEKGFDLNFDTPRERKYLEMLISSEKPDLLIIDSCPSFTEADQNDGQKQNEIAKYLKSLAVRFDMAIVLITHLRKRRLQDEEAEPCLSEIQGSNAPIKIANVVLVLFSKSIETGGEFKKIKVCKSVKSWGVPILPFGFELPDYGENSLVINMVEIPKGGKTKGSWEIVNEALQGKEFSRQELQELLSVSDKTAKNTLAEWTQQGKVTRKGSGKNTVYIVSKSQIDPPMHISSPNENNSVIPTNDSGKAFFPECTPEKENRSGKLGFPESYSVIPTNYNYSGKNRESGVLKEKTIEDVLYNDAHKWIESQPEMKQRLMEEAERAKEDPIMFLNTETEYSMLVVKEYQKTLKDSGEYNEERAQQWIDGNTEAKELYQEKYDRMNKFIKSEEVCRETCLLRTWEHFHQKEVA